MEEINLEMLECIETNKGKVYIGLDPYYMDFEDIREQGYTPLLVRVRRKTSSKDEPYGEVIREARSYFSNEYPKKGELFYCGEEEKFREKYIYPLFNHISGKDSEELSDLKRNLDDMIFVLKDIERCGENQVVRVEGTYSDILDKVETCVYRYQYKYYIGIA